MWLNKKFKEEIGRFKREIRNLRDIKLVRRRFNKLEEWLFEDVREIKARFREYKIKGKIILKELRTRGDFTYFPFLERYRTNINFNI